MSANRQKVQAEENFMTEFKRMRRQIEEMTRTPRFVVPKLSTDPSSPVDGEVWVNTTSNDLKIRLNSVTRVVTVT